MTSSYDLNFPIDLNHMDEDRHRRQPEADQLFNYLSLSHTNDDNKLNYLSLSHTNDDNKPPVLDAASSLSCTCSNSSSYSSSSSFLHHTPPPPPPYNCPIYFNPSSQDHHQAAAAPAGCYEYEPHPKLVVDLDQINKMELHQSDNQATAAASGNDDEINNMISRRREIIDSPVVKCKMRRLIMKKKKKKTTTTTTTTSDHNKKGQKQTPNGDDDEQYAPESDINFHVCTVNATVRVCADCNTTKTPLWRSGPRGPKSLCNACGIRQMKARRAAILAANNTGSVTGSGLSRVVVPLQYHMTGTSNNTSTMRSCSTNNININPDHEPPLSSPAPAPDHPQANQYCDDQINQRKICFEEFAHSLTKNLSIDQQVLFPQEEKDAAILLMALSCHGRISIPAD